MKIGKLVTVDKEIVDQHLQAKMQDADLRAIFLQVGEMRFLATIHTTATIMMAQLGIPDDEDSRKLAVYMFVVGHLIGQDLGYGRAMGDLAR